MKFFKRRKLKSNEKKLSELIFRNEYVMLRGFNLYDRAGNRISGKDRLLTDLFLEHHKLEEETRKQRTQEKTNLEFMRDMFVSAYSSVDLRECPLCGEQSKIFFTSKKYTQTEGFAGGWDIGVKLYCKTCGCCLEEAVVYSNICFVTDQYTFDKACKKIDQLITKWNNRVLDLSVSRHYAGIATDIVDPEEDKPSAEETNVTD